MVLNNVHPGNTKSPLANIKVTCTKIEQTA